MGRIATTQKKLVKDKIFQNIVFVECINNYLSPKLNIYVGLISTILLRLGFLSKTAPRESLYEKRV